MLCELKIKNSNYVKNKKILIKLTKKSLFFTNKYIHQLLFGGLLYE